MVEFVHLQYCFLIGEHVENTLVTGFCILFHLVRVGEKRVNGVGISLEVT